MPWKEHRTLDLRETFVLQAKGPSANMAELCREFGISRKTGYKWLARYDALGVDGLRDMSRRPQRVISTSGEVVLGIIEARRAHPRWGPKKLREVLKRRRGAHDVPSVRTIARILMRAGEPLIRKRRVTSASVATYVPVKADVNHPNDLWTVDFKGWWRTLDGQRCEPLTVRDAHSRCVLCVKLMRSTSWKSVKQVFEKLFEGNGLPKAIWVDNGSPFASTRARGGLTRLSAWWVALGIRVLRSRPGHPEDNGAHERMHGDMRWDLEDNAARSVAEQQKACDRWVEEFNHIRPHEALGMRTPGELYRRSARRYQGPRRPSYPSGYLVRKVDVSGHVRLRGSRFFVGGGLGGFLVGCEEPAEGRYRVWFYEEDLGLLDSRREDREGSRRAGK
jgi:putative transposase